MNNIVKEKKELTKSEEKVYNYIKEYILEYGYAPTVREICDGTKLKSTSTIHHHIKNLLQKGWIETNEKEGSPRAIRLTGYKVVKNLN